MCKYFWCHEEQGVKFLIPIRKEKVEIILALMSCVWQTILVNFFNMY